MPAGKSAVVIEEYVTLLSAGAVQYWPVSRPDVFDYVGMALLAMIVALWVAHFVLPPAPPALPLDPEPPTPSMLAPGNHI